MIAGEMKKVKGDRKKADINNGNGIKIIKSI